MKKFAKVRISKAIVIFLGIMLCVNGVGKSLAQDSCPLEPNGEIEISEFEAPPATESCSLEGGDPVPEIPKGQGALILLSLMGLIIFVRSRLQKSPRSSAIRDKIV